MARVEESYPAHPKKINAQGRLIESEVNYIVFDVVDEDAALSAVLNSIPEKLNNLPLDEISINERLEETTFSVVASYSTSGGSSSDSDDDDDDSDTSADEDIEPTLSFSCTTGTIHLSEAYEQRQILGKKDAKKLIGWNGKTGDDFRVNGVDVAAPKFHESYTKKMLVSQLTTAYRRKIGSMISTVNRYKFKGWEPGEVMFESISFSAPLSKGADAAVEVTFDFAIQLNEENYEFAGKTVSKKGFEYAWAIPATVVNENNLALTSTDAYIARVFKYSDFSLLGL